MGDLMAAIRNAHEAGDTKSANRLAAMLRAEDKPQQADNGMPDLPPEMLNRLPDNPAEYAASLSKPESEWVQRQYDRKAASEMGGMETFTASAGKGVINLARGLGLMDMPDDREKQRWEAAEAIRPKTTMAGEITGEAIPFLPLGGAIGQIASTGKRIAAAGALGGAEAGISSRGRTGDETQALQSGGLGVLLGAGLEAAIPYIGRAVGATYRKLTGIAPPSRVLDDAGRPTPEVQAVLDDAGISFDEFSQATVRQLQDLPAGANPEQAARIAQFSEANIPYTKGDISQELGQQTTEARLFESASDPTADPFRQRRLEQSQAIKSELEAAAGAGSPELAGSATKEALASRLASMKANRRELYASAKEQARSAGGVPVQVDNIASALPTDEMADLAITAPAQTKALDSMMVKYGLKDAPEGFSGEVTPLSVENVERFRKSLKAIERSDDTGAISVAIGPVTRAVDNELDVMTEAGINIPPSLRDTLKSARKAVRDEKTEFDRKSMVGKLVGTKKNSAEQMVESSKIIPKLFAKGTPIEDLQKTMRSLDKAGEEGKSAISNMQSAAVMQIMEEAFGAGTRKIDGIPTFGAGAYKKAIDKIGKDKLNVLFRDNKQARNKLKSVEQIAKLIQPSGAAIPKGSAMVNLDIAEKMFSYALSTKIPFVDTLLGVVKNANDALKKGKSVTEAIAAKPDQLKLVQEMGRSFPALSQALGVSGVSQSMDE